MPSPDNNEGAERYDAAIVGGGPAGLSAALWLARYLRRVVVIDAGDPRNWSTRGIHGYLGLHGIRPPDLRERGRAEGRGHGVEFVDAVVTEVDRAADAFVVNLGRRRRIEAQRLLLAIGVRDVWPDIPGIEACFGNTVHVCPDCDGYEARGCRTVVVGVGRRAVGMALSLATWTRDLVVCTNGRPADLDEHLTEKLRVLDVPVIEDRVARAVSAGGSLQALELETGGTVPCQRLFFSIAAYPSDDLGAALGCARTEEGLLVVDEHYRTTVPHVYAVGDIVPGPRLAIAAASDGALAALSVHKSLLPEEQKLD